MVFSLRRLGGLVPLGMIVAACGGSSGGGSPDGFDESDSADGIGADGSRGTAAEAGADGSRGAAAEAGADGSRGAAAEGGADGSGATVAEGGADGSEGTVAEAGADGSRGPAPEAGADGAGGTVSEGGEDGSGAKPADGGADGSGRKPAEAGADGAGGPDSGTPGLGPWITGYAATMFGNDSMGDCSGYANFSDTTNIADSACASNGTVSIAGYSSTTANDASYYGAPGDLSSIWQGGECTCQAGTGSGTGNCTAPPSCPMEQDCGKCVAVKCDPNGTITEGGFNHDQYCSTSEYVVIEVIDACPHNHPTNEASSEGWCTSTQANHIDLSCSALGGISDLGTNIGQQGWLNVDVQIVPCSLGLGLHSL
jgi:hypothetical protein